MLLKNFNLNFLKGCSFTVFFLEVPALETRGWSTREATKTSRAVRIEKTKGGLPFSQICNRPIAALEQAHGGAC